MKYKSPGSERILEEMIQAEVKLQCEIHYYIDYIWNKEELPDHWNETIIVPLHEKGDKTDYNQYHGTSLLST
jgi:hypothetical protein